MKRWFRVILFVTCCLLAVGCGEKNKQPTTLTIWHVYGGQTDSPLNNLIDVFNQTVGKEQNISVQVTSVTNTNTIHQGVLAAANNDPGAPDLPDMFISYPKTVLAMPDDDILVDYRDYFTPEELEAFVPSFIEDGMINGRMRILPVAKSAEVMFVNETLFKRFAAATGAQLSDLGIWEDLFKMAEEYEAWCGKSFFVHDYHFNYFQIGTESLGEHFFDDRGIVFGDAFRRAWDPYVRAAIHGGVWLYGGYATEPLRTGDAVVSVASSASVLYYSDCVTYPDNTSEQVNFIVRPCPVFRDGEKLVMQRGAGICTVRSTPEREQAAMVFLKWLTEPERNVEFVTSVGYMPVCRESFPEYLPQAITKLEDPKYQKLYQAFIDTQRDYQFYTAPQRDDYLELETGFEEQVRLLLSAARKELTEGANEEVLCARVLEQLEETFRK